MHRVYYMYLYTLRRRRRKCATRFPPKTRLNLYALHIIVIIIIIHNCIIFFVSPIIIGYDKN